MTDIEEAQLKQEIAALKRENNAAMKTVNKLLKDLSEKNKQLEHFKSMVQQVVPIIKKEVVTSVTPEEEIADHQLERLRQVAKTRTLTLEEIRSYDLLVKNKRLSQDESTINVSKANYRDVSDAALLQIAGQDDSDDHS